MRKRKIKKYCRLYKYVCPACGSVRHKRHYVRPGDLCTKCQGPKIDDSQESLFATNEKTDERRA